MILAAATTPTLSFDRDTIDTPCSLPGHKDPRGNTLPPPHGIVSPGGRTFGTPLPRSWAARYTRKTRSKQVGMHAVREEPGKLDITSPRAPPALSTHAQRLSPGPHPFFCLLLPHFPPLLSSLPSTLTILKSSTSDVIIGRHCHSWISRSARAAASYHRGYGGDLNCRS